MVPVGFVPLAVQFTAVGEKKPDILTVIWWGRDR